MPYSADGQWQNWTATAATNATVWVTWAANTTVTTASTVAVWDQWTIQPTHVRQPSAEEITERQRVAAEQRQAAAEAAERARAILLENLDDSQRGELESDGHFHVETADGRRRYRLRPGSPPIRVQGEDGRRWSYCIHPLHSYPIDDVTLALKLLLDADEERFLQIANATAVRA